MAVNARVALDRANGASGTSVSAAVVVSNAGEAQPVTVSLIHLYASRGSAAHFSANSMLFGGGAGAGASTPEVIPHTVNVNTSRAYPFSLSAFGLMGPADGCTNVIIGANVVLSDGTIVVAETATYTVCPPEYVSAAGIGEQPTSRFIGSKQGALDFSSNSNTIYAQITHQ
jgi:hypothetical protein